MKSVQIPYDLFIDLAMYHLRGEDDFEEEIRQGLEQEARRHAEPAALFPVQNRSQRRRTGAGAAGVS